MLISRTISMAAKKRGDCFQISLGGPGRALLVCAYKGNTSQLMFVIKDRLKMKKQRPRELPGLPQGHTTRKYGHLSI